MSIQEVAHLLLREHRRPMTAKQLAQIALERGLVHSNAQKPIDSHAQTLEKNIRDGTYNQPELVFLDGPQRLRLLKFPEWPDQPQADRSAPESGATVEMKARIPTDLLEQVQPAVQARIANGFDETVAALLRGGVSAELANIRRGLMEQLEKLPKEPTR